MGEFELPIGIPHALLIGPPKWNWEMAMPELESGAKAALAELVGACYAAHIGDARSASELLYQRLQADPALYAEVADGFVKSQCWHLIGKMRRQLRHDAWTAPNYEQGLADGPQKVRDLGRANRSLMDGFPMLDGTPLGDADRAKLVEDGTAYRAQAAAADVKAAFLASIAAKLPEGKRVRDVLTEGDLISLRERAVGRKAA